MVGTPFGPSGHLVRTRVESEKNLDLVPVLILNQCMEEMTAQIWVLVPILQIVWIGIAQVIHVMTFESLVIKDLHITTW